MSIPPKPSTPEPPITTPIRFSDWDRGNFRASTLSFDHYKIDKKALAAKLSASTRTRVQSSPLVAVEESSGIAPVNKRTQEVVAGFSNSRHEDSDYAVQDDTPTRVEERFPKFVSISPLNGGSVTGGNGDCEQIVLNNMDPKYLQPTPAQVTTSPVHRGDAESESHVDTLYTGPHHVSSRGLSNDHAANNQFPRYYEGSEDGTEAMSTAVEISEGRYDTAVTDAEASDTDSVTPIDTPKGSPDGTSEVHMPISPPVVFRFIRGGPAGRAPFLKQHLITSFPTAPFAGSHTAIKISFGLDSGKWLHIFEGLRAAELDLAEMAIDWLYFGFRRNEGRISEAENTAIKMAPSPYQIAGFKMMGPPDALFPMTESVKPPFLGPRTFIKNNGRRLDGWILHVPQFLTREEIAVATENLPRTYNRPYLWASRLDPDCSRGVKRSLAEDTEVIDLLKQQDNSVVFLRNVVGLDFAAQDEAQGGETPIWAKRGSIWKDPETLATLYGGQPTPALESGESSAAAPDSTPCPIRPETLVELCDEQPTPVLEQEPSSPEAPDPTPCPVRNYGSVSIGSSPSEPSFVTVANTPNDIRKRLTYMHAQLGVLISKSTIVRNENLPPFPPLKDEFAWVEEELPSFPPSEDSEDSEDDFEYAAEDLPSLPPLTPSEDGSLQSDEEEEPVTLPRSGGGFPDILRKLVLYTGPRGVVRLDLFPDSSSPVVNGSLQNGHFLIESPTYHKSIQARLAELEAAGVHIPPEVVLTIAESADLKFFMRRHLLFTQTDLIVEIVANLIWDIINFAFHHVVLTIPSYLVGIMMADKHDFIRESVIRPRDVTEWLDHRPDRKLIISFAVATVTELIWVIILFVDPLWAMWRRMSAEGRGHVVMGLTIACYMYADAIESAETWRQFPMILA
jgi:hypothetical protein